MSLPLNINLQGLHPVLRYPKPCAMTFAGQQISWRQLVQGTLGIWLNTSAISGLISVSALVEPKTGGT